MKSYDKYKRGHQKITYKNKAQLGMQKKIAKKLNT